MHFRVCDADKRHFHSWAAPHPSEGGMCQGRVRHPRMCPWQQSVHLLMIWDNLMSKWTGSYRCLGLPLFIPSAFWPVKDRALQRPCWSILGNGLSTDTEATEARAREFPGGPVGRTRRFHWGCPGFHPWSGNQDPASHTAQSKIIKITVSTQKECPVCTEHHCFMKYFKTTEKP